MSLPYLQPPSALLQVPPPLHASPLSPPLSPHVWQSNPLFWLSTQTWNAPGHAAASPVLVPHEQTPKPVGAPLRQELPSVVHRPECALASALPQYKHGSGLPWHCEQSLTVPASTPLPHRYKPPPPESVVPVSLPESLPVPVSLPEVTSGDAS